MCDGRLLRGSQGQAGEIGAGFKTETRKNTDEIGWAMNIYIYNILSMWWNDNKNSKYTSQSWLQHIYICKSKCVIVVNDLDLCVVFFVSIQLISLRSAKHHYRERFIIWDWHAKDFKICQGLGAENYQKCLRKLYYNLRHSDLLQQTHNGADVVCIACMSITFGTPFGYTLDFVCSLLLVSIQANISNGHQEGVLHHYCRVYILRMHFPLTLWFETDTYCSTMFYQSFFSIFCEESGMPEWRKKSIYKGCHLFNAQKTS